MNPTLHQSSYDASYPPELTGNGLPLDVTVVGLESSSTNDRSPSSDLGVGASLGSGELRDGIHQSGKRGGNGLTPKDGRAPTK